MRYRIRLINTETGESMLAWGFTNRKKAEEYAEQWNNLGEPDKRVEVVDTKKR